MEEDMIEGIILAVIINVVIFWPVISAVFGLYETEDEWFARKAKEARVINRVCFNERAD
jgi:hypothetical protein